MPEQTTDRKLNTIRMGLERGGRAAHQAVTDAQSLWNTNPELGIPLAQLLNTVLPNLKDDDVRTKIEALLKHMKEKGVNVSPANPSPPLDAPSAGFSADENAQFEQAEDAYYAGEYQRAWQLYQKVPAARILAERMAKIEARLLSPDDPLHGVPRPAQQNYRRASSYLNAGQFEDAHGLLDEAVKIAEQANIDFREAKDLLVQVEKVLALRAARREVTQLLQQENYPEAKQKLMVLKEKYPDGEDAHLLDGLNTLLKLSVKVNTRRTFTETEIDEFEKLAAESPALLSTTLYQRTAKFLEENQQKIEQRTEQQQAQQRRRSSAKRTGVGQSALRNYF